MNIFLINPPFYFRNTLEYLTQNLGLGYIASSLMAAGHRVEALDALAEGMDQDNRVHVTGRMVSRIGLSYEEISARIPSGTDLVGITAPFSNHAIIIDELVAEIRKKLPNTPIILGGVYPSTQPERALRSGADYVVVGEGEGPMLALASGKTPAEIPGIWRREGKKIVDGGRAEFIADINSIPFPARHLFPMDKYMILSPRARPNLPTATLISSRGCPFDCAFCSIHPVYSRKWRARTADNVLAEVDELINKWGVKYIEFEDDNLTMDRERAKSIFTGLAERMIQWSCSNGLKADSLDEELLHLMKKSGCEVIHLAVESGDPGILKAMNKKVDLKKVGKTIEACAKLDLPVVMFMIVGYPGETEQSFRKSMTFVRRMRKKGMFACGVHIATPYPGTKLLQLCREKGYLVNDRIEELVLLPGDINIKTPDFGIDDVFTRMYTMKVAGGTINNFTGGFAGFVRWKVKPLLSKIGLLNRKYMAEMNESDIEGFHESLKMPDGVTLRWTNGDGRIKVNVPKRARTMFIMANSNRTHKARVFIDEVAVGDIYLNPQFNVKTVALFPGVPRGKAVMRLHSDARSAYDRGEGDDKRPRGFKVSWFEFSRRRKFSSDTNSQP